MGLMELRRGLMMGMAQGTKAEMITIPNEVITNTKDIDTYFSSLVSGWNSETILLYNADVPESPANNLFIACWSSYAVTLGGFYAHVGRFSVSTVQGITRNDWGIKLNPGDKYYVVRF